MRPRLGGERLVEDIDDLPVEFVLVDGVADIEALVAHHVVASDQAHDLVEVAVVLGGAQGHDEPVAGGVGVVERVDDLPAVLRVLVAVLGGDHRRVEHEHARVEQRGGHVVPLPGLLTGEQRSEDAGGEHEGDLEVSVAVGGDHRAGAAVDGGPQDAAARHAGGHVEASRVLEGAARAEAEDLGHDEAREPLVEGVEVVAEFGEGFDASGGEEDVGAGQQAVHGFASRVLVKVDGDEALVGVRHVEAEVLVVGVGGAEHGALGAAGIALGRLDLDDVGPPFAEDARDGGGGQECCHIDNRDAGKGVHGYLVAGEGEGSPGALGPRTRGTTGGQEFHRSPPVAMRPRAAVVRWTVGGPSSSHMARQSR